MIPKALERCSPHCPHCGAALAFPHQRDGRDDNASKIGPLTLTVKCLACDQCSVATFIREQA